MQKKLKKFVVGTNLLFTLLCANITLAELVEEGGVANKIWETDSLYPSLSYYLAVADIRQQKGVEPVELPAEDRVLVETFAALGSEQKAEAAPEKIQLNLRQAMQVALSGNSEVQLAMLAPEIAGTDLAISKTVYDPTFFSDGNYYDSERPIQSLLDTGSDGSGGNDSLEEEGWASQTGMRQPLPSGGSLSLYYEADNLENNSELTIPNPQYTSRFKFELKQSLLKGVWDKSNSSEVELASITKEQSDAQYRVELAGLLKELTLYYYRFSYYHKLEAISHSGVESAKAILARLETRNEQGIANLLDLDRARSTLHDRTLRNLGDRKLVQTTLDQLKLLLGVETMSPYFYADFEPTEPFVLDFSLPDRSRVQKNALLKRDEIAVARAEMELAETNLKLARHMELPTLDARTTYTMNGLGEEYGDSVDSAASDGEDAWDAGLYLEWQLGGRKASLETQKAILLQKKAKYEYKRKIEKIAYEVNSILTDARFSLEEVTAANRSKESYAEVFDREKALFDISRADNQRLLDSQDEYYDAQRAYLKAVLNLNLSILNLQWVQGLFLETFQIDV